MRTEEMSQLLALYSDPSHWCRHAEARNARGTPVRYGDPSAVAWDLTGALCMLFGWERACVLFRQIDKHLLRDRALRWRILDSHIESMLALQECNDRAGTTLDWLINRLQHMSTIERDAAVPAADRPSALAPVLSSR